MSPKFGKVLITSDLQLADNPRDEYRFNFIEHVLPHLVGQYNVKVVLILGDLTEEKDRHAAALVNRIVEAIFRLSCKCDVVLLQGNHDFNFDSSRPFFGFTNRLLKVNWIRQPTEGEKMKFTSLGGNSIDWIIGPSIFLPYTRDHKQDWKMIDFNKYDWVFAHNTFEGADAGHGHILSGIPTSIFAKRNLVIAGDVHTPQDIGPVTYVGSPYLCDFGDDYKPRVLLIDSSRKLTSLNIKGPNKRLVEFDARLRALTQPILNEGDIVKVRVKLTQAEYEQWSEIRDRIYSWGDKSGFVIHIIQPVVDKSALARKSPIHSRKLNDEGFVKRYVSSQAAGEKILKTGLRYLK